MLKYLKLLLMGAMLLITVGCAGVDNTEKEAEKTSDAVLTENSQSKKIESSETESVDPLLVTQGELLQVGEYSLDKTFGKIILEKIANPGNRVEVSAGVFVTFGKVKIINFSEIPDSAREDAEWLYGFKGNQGYDLQFEYTVENTNDFKIANAAIEKVILSDGEQIIRSMYMDEAINIEAGSKVSNQIGHVAIPTSDIDSVKMYLSPFHYDTFDTLDAQPVEISFE